jgi:C-terminal processing protease CtpA/Prc
MQLATPRRALIAALTALLPALVGPTVMAQYTPFNAESRAETLASVCEMMKERYVFPEVAEACAEHLMELHESGELDLGQPETFAAQLTEELQKISKDKHLRVRVQQVLPDEPTPEETAEFERRELAESRQRNFGFEQILRAPGNVGVLDLRSFQDVGSGGETAAAAMNFLAGSDAIIVDLRQNGGGDPEMVQLLCSYFFDQPTHLNSLYWRASDETVEFWTLDELQGRRMPDVPLFVLTSPYTFSGAEEFAYNMQTQKRATLIGETTGGGAHPGGMVNVGNRFAMFIPTGRAINPITGTNWEGTGVEPDIATSTKDAMGKAMSLARKAAEKHREMLKQQS